MAKTAKKVPRWGIYLLRKRGQYIGSVEAPDAKAAIATAIKKFGITDPNRQQRLSAQREG